MIEYNGFFVSCEVRHKVFCIQRHLAMDTGFLELLEIFYL